MSRGVRLRVVLKETIPIPHDGGENQPTEQGRRGRKDNPPTSVNGLEGGRTPEKKAWKLARAPDLGPQSLMNASNRDAAQTPRNMMRTDLEQ